MDSTSARPLANEVMNQVVPTRTVEAASTSVLSPPSQIRFVAYATEASGWMRTEKAASVCPQSAHFAFFFCFYLFPCFSIFGNSPSKTFRPFFKKKNRYRWMWNWQRWMWRQVFQSAGQLYLLLPGRLPARFQRQEMHRYRNWHWIMQSFGGSSV